MLFSKSGIVILVLPQNMDLRTKKDLEKARCLFLEGRLLEAYGLLRRYYDRLPFKPEKEHADNIGIFARTLLELNKEYELKFYMSELEKLYEAVKSCELGYQLAGIYCVGPETNIKAAKNILNQVIRETTDATLRAKAKMLLAYCYDIADGDVAACRKIIDSVEDPLDETTMLQVDIWRAKVLRDEKRYDEAETLLTKLISNLTPSSNWYAYFTAKNVLAVLYIRKEEHEKASQLVEELREIFRGKKFNSVRLGLESLEREIAKKSNLGPVTVYHEEIGTEIKYANKKVTIRDRSAAEKLLAAMVKRGFLDREMIVKVLYNRNYVAENDDKLVYYHIHALRKFLGKLGLPNEAVALEGSGYRLVPEIRVLEAET